MSSAVPIGKSRPSRNAFPLRLFAAAFAISLLGAALGAGLSWHLNHRFDAARNRGVQLDEYVGQAKLFDEVLTMSARMTAATGDFSYKDSYDKFDADLDALIKKTASALSPPEVRPFVKQTHEANVKLVGMERRAFALASEGRRREATALLVSDEYLRWKRVYAEGVEKTAAWQRGAIERKRRTLDLLLGTVEASGGLAILALVLTWYVASRSGRRWSLERLESETTLREAHDELEQRVKERTAELHFANETLRHDKEALARDIQERKRGEAALRESQQIIAAMLDAVPARIFWKDKSLVYLGCNAPFARDAGFVRPEDVIGKDDYQMGWREQADKYRSDDREVIKSDRGKLLIDEPQTTPEGKVITLLTSKVPLRDPNGEVFGVLGTYLDVTERARLQEQLATRTLQFDAALNNMVQGMLMFDRDGKLVISNKRFAELFKLPWEKWKTACLGRPVPEAMRLAAEWTNVSEKNQEQIIAALQSVLARKKPGRILFERTDGSTFSSWTAPMANGGFVVTFEDITEQRRTDEKISHMAHYDSLTDMPNRVLFYEKLDQLLARLPRGGSFAVFSLDLDHFKSVNDMLGHPIGDKLLQVAAKRMCSCIRDTDIVARVGGDECNCPGRIQATGRCNLARDAPDRYRERALCARRPSSRRGNKYRHCHRAE